MSGSTADLYPRLVAMQRAMAATTFAVLSARAATLISPGQLSVVMEGPPGTEGSLVSDLIASEGPKLLSHLRVSPHPVILAGGEARPLFATRYTSASDPADSRTGIAFPVQLGAMGNGYTVFFAERLELSADILIDLHRKSFSIMREALKLEFGSIAAPESLNAREIECLQLVGNGMKSEAIGDALNLSVHTVNAYLGSATTKLDAVNRIQAIAKAIRIGLIG
ncbi:helix-turn-helix domain-containing protein [Hoeflea marina]|nr:helix-turn-helix transcriptional regulator [Hoeflea marina]